MFSHTNLLFHKASQNDSYERENTIQLCLYTQRKFFLIVFPWYDWGLMVRLESVDGVIWQARSVDTWVWLELKKELFFIRCGPLCYFSFSWHHRCSQNWRRTRSSQITSSKREKERNCQKLWRKNRSRCALSIRKSASGLAPKIVCTSCSPGWRSWVCLAANRAFFVDLAVKAVEKWATLPDKRAT